MSAIRILENQIINQICAGEIVEGPSSIVKELVENSIDASASKIVITLKDSGKTFISVQDDGTGILREDLNLALTRHATSKLDDITWIKDFNIKSFGFRGEALASIDSVGNVTITSKTIHDEHGFKLENNIITPASHPLGTTVVVRDLFYATPVRLKFLKSEQSEIIKCISWIKRLALSSYYIEFILKDDDRTLLHYPKAWSWKERFSQVFKNQEDFCFIEENDCIGAISLPTYHKSSNSDQIFFVNNRFVKDKIFQVALKQTYSDLVPNLRYPLCCIYIQVPFEEVDINVHPCKTEVRFRDVSYIRSILVNSMQKSLNSNKTSSHLGQFVIDRAYENMPTLHSIRTDPNKYKHNHFIYKRDFECLNDSNQILEIKNEEDKKRFIGHFKKTYLFIENGDELLLIDQHAAHERIIYERLKSNKIKSQVLLIPKQLELTKDEINAIKDNLDYINKFGFEVEFFDEKLIVKNVPCDLDKSDLEEVFQAVCIELINHKNTDIIKDIIFERLATIACKNSIKAGKELNKEEVLELLVQMENTKNFAQCNHGRPTYVKLTLSDIKSLFGRT